MLVNRPSGVLRARGSASDGPGGPDGAAAQGRARRIAGAALPLCLTMIASSAASVVDTAVLGRHGTGPLAAFAVTMAVFGPAAAAVSGAMRGVMPFVSEHRDDPDRLLPVLRNGMWLGILVGVPGAVAVAAVPVIGRAGGVPESTLRELGAFPCLLAGAVVVMSVGATATSALVGLGRSRAVLRSGMAGTVAAVVLSLVLVGGAGSFDGLGLPGAGVAMLVSAAVNASLAHRLLRRSTVLAGRRPGLGRPRPREVLRLAGIGIPLAATVLIKFAVLGVLAFSAARIGTDSAAVHSIALSLVNPVFTAAVAVGQATVPLMADPVRRGDVAEIRRTASAGVGVALGAVAALAGLLVLAGGPVISVFTHDPGLRGRLLELLPLVLLTVVADAVQAVLGFGLVGIRRTLPSLAVFAVCYGLLALAAVPVAAAGGLAGLWLALAGANLLLAAGQAYFFRSCSGSLAAADPVRVNA
ncbi:MATE family efflux transporter [Streptomyces poriticola]|uniref:MATE family efflux transporter n=1 Tax=Streptomyces poriticola TaxID=3120506 RepID=UPI002FCDECE8